MIEFPWTRARASSSRFRLSLFVIVVTPTLSCRHVPLLQYLPCRFKYSRVVEPGLTADEIRNPLSHRILIIERGDFIV